MPSASVSSNINIRVDSDIKSKAQDVFTALGLDMTSAINIFLRQAIRKNGIPFELVTNQPRGIYGREKRFIMNIEEKIKSLGITLPEAPKKGGVYTPCKQFGGGLTYLSGCVPVIDGKNITGKLGKDCSLEDGRKAAENCVLNLLAVIKRDIGSLDKIKSIIKMTVFVASAEDFYQHPQVADAATELLVKIFGEDIGCPSRSAVGVSALPGNAAVEIEILAEVGE
jgi:addiction module RelB/DinJ family antitoxin